MAIDKPAQFTINGTIEERTVRVSIDCPRGGPYTITAAREKVQLDALGNPLAPPVPAPTVTKIIDGLDPEAAIIAKMVADKIDKWAQGL